MTRPTLPRLGRPVALAIQTAPGVCNCIAGARCALPGGHPLLDRWWTPAPIRPSADPDTKPATRAATAAGGASHAVLIPPGIAVLQIPAPLRAVLLQYLASHLLTPPAVHSPLRSWVWVAHAAPRQLVDQHPRYLPHPAALRPLWPGAWAPVPPAQIAPDRDLWWGGRPGADPLTHEEFLALHGRLVIAAQTSQPARPWWSTP